MPFDLRPVPFTGTGLSVVPGNRAWLILLHMIETSEARAILSGILGTYGIACTLEPIAERTFPWGNEEGPEHRRPLHFRATLSSEPLGTSHAFEYSVGSAHPIQWAAHLATFPASMPSELKRFRGSVPSIEDDLRRIGGRWHRNSMSIHDASIVSILRKHYRPEAVDVVACVLMDLSHYEPDCSFHEWCDTMSGDLGMEWSNPADALEQFKDARALARFLVPAFGDALEHAREAAAEI